VIADPPFRLVRDALGFYSQVPIEEPLIAEDAVEVVVVEPPVKRMGRRPTKKRLNAEFEVDV
jgi:hypothetical protein